jgi:hypothetical protein
VSVPTDNIGIEHRDPAGEAWDDARRVGREISESRQTHDPGTARASAELTPCRPFPDGEGGIEEYGGWDSNPHVPKDNAF